jgi:hypothetical protein
LDKKQLEEEKEKLEKYRKELEKEKEELLREVEKFMKEKKKESNLLALMKDNKAMHKFTRNYKCNGINHKIIHKIEKHQQKIESITLKYDLKDLKSYSCQDHYHLCPNSTYPYPYPAHSLPEDCPQSLYLPDSPLDSPIDSPLDSSLDSSLAQFLEDKVKMKEIQQAVAKDLMGEAKLTKKQQKLKKKQEHDAVMALAGESPTKLESKRSERSSIGEQEASLNNFLERLRIDEDTRVPCNVE